jgi:RNA polymerase sigma factor (sigma-70 family)
MKRKGDGTLEDQKIIALLFERSEQGMTELIAKYGKLLRRIAWNILGNALDAEECANDTYLSVWNAIPPEQPRSLAAFCCAIARNNALSRYQWDNAQKRNSHYDIALDELGETVPALGNAESETEARELTDGINRFLAAQRKEDRYLFVRRYYFADSVAELAAQTGKSPHSVSVRLFRIREKLQKNLRKEGLLP